MSDDRKVMNFECPRVEPARIFLTGTVRNGGPKLSQRIFRLNKQFSTLGEVHFFVVESDSKDSTLESLGKLKGSLTYFEYRNLGELRHHIENREERLAFCREVALTEFKAREERISYDFFVVADLDGVNDKLSQRQLAKAFSMKDYWDACFPNQSKLYYDIGALRANGWLSLNPYSQMREAQSIGLDPKVAFNLNVGSKMIHLPRTSSPIVVNSAFGGLGIYKAQFAKKSSYARKNQDNKETIVEHVIFNLRIRDLGGRLVILPFLLNASWTDHTINKSKRWAMIYMFFVPFRDSLRKLMKPEYFESLSAWIRKFLS